MSQTTSKRAVPLFLSGAEMDPAFRAELFDAGHCRLNGNRARRHPMADGTQRPTFR